MYQTRSAYDRGVNTFSPEGRLFQVEYAIKAIELGSCALGVRTDQGVVLAVEKRTASPLMEGASVHKIMEVDSHIGCAVSGFTADARILVEHARVECANHRFTYDEPLRVESLTQSVCDLALSFGEGGEGEENRSKMSRPFGVALLIAGVDPVLGAQLFTADPSGTYSRTHAHAIGIGSEGARTLLGERYSKTMSLDAAGVLVVRVLAETLEDRVTPGNIELVRVSVGGGYAVYSKEEVEALIARAAAEAAAEGAP